MEGKKVEKRENKERKEKSDRKKLDLVGIEPMP